MFLNITQQQLRHLLQRDVMRRTLFSAVTPVRIAAEVTFRFAIFSSGEYHSRVAPTANHQPTEHIIRVGPSSRLLDFDTLLYCIKGGLIDQRFLCVLYDNPFFRRTLYDALVLERSCSIALDDQFS